ncbi:MAG: pseudouridine synthase [Chthoniobacteraceae bacterium]
MRINRFLASAGLGSRRSCEELILTGQVTINGVACESLATTVEPTDVVKIGNRVLRTSTPMTIVINKPPGFLCTASDTHARQTVFDLLPPNTPRLFHVGRLDMESEGLLMLTNDGDLSLKLTHPRYKVAKEYEVVLNHPFDVELVPKLLHGMSLEEGWAKAEAVYKLAPNKVKVVLRQGLKRQIRNMFYAVGYEVIKLVRTRIGPLTLGDMPPGAFRAVTHAEIDALLEEGAKTAAETPERPRRVYKPRPAYARGGQGGHGHEERPFKERHFAEDRPIRHESREREPERSGGKRPFGARPGASRGGQAKVEEIPFVPRSRRADAKPEGDAWERKPRTVEHKPWLKKKHAASEHAGPKTAHGPKKPHPFAKFARREREF